MTTDNVKGTLYEIRIIGFCEDIVKVENALLKAVNINRKEVRSTSRESSVYVNPDDIARAVSIINDMGYETDEDPYVNEVEE
jgi:hypothetical protein